MGTAVESRTRRPGYGRYLSLKLLLLGVMVSIGVASGCQYQEISPLQMEIHQSQLNKQGLTPLHVDRELKITCAPPDMWDSLAKNRTILYTHQQWRSPDRHVGMGVAYAHTLVPLSPSTIIWLARQNYAAAGDKAPDGKVLGQQTDSLGRCWFEGEDAKYHVIGYAMTRGCDAWVVYSGYRIKSHPSKAELDLAAKAAETVAPLADEDAR